MNNAAKLIVPQKVWQVLCRIPRTGPGIEELYGALVGAGIDPAIIVEQIKKGEPEIVIFPTSAKEAAGLLRTIRSAPFRGLKVSLKILQRADWQERWKKGIKPFSLTKSFYIIPRWTKTRYRKKSKIPIYIDTNLAFGTGLHETTRFMAQLIEECRGGFDSFLDVGTGSGILAIIAKYCDAKAITAFDIDPQSIAVAKTNLAANHVKGVKLLCADAGTWKSRTTYDFVAANLITDDLVAFGKKLVVLVKPNKFLAVSGISLKNLPRLLKAFKSLPLKKIKVLKGKEWSAVLYTKL